MTWTHFMDMHSGGGTKVPPFEDIYIEAPRSEAISVFYSRFHRNPERVTCTCCGQDYSIDEEKDLAQATGYHRNCKYYGPPRDPGGGYRTHNEQGRYFEKDEDIPEGWISVGDPYKPYIPLEMYLIEDDVKIIYASEIEPHEKTVDVPEEGYVWHD